MLDPKENRIDYGNKLIPPEGYELDYAVGTTYSLDLDTLMVLPVALFYSQTLDSKPDELRYDILDAITRAAKKIRVYYQEGKIAVPRKYSNLIAYWECGIRGIRMPDFASSFHPKVWVIRFIAQGKHPYYRLLITSRNLTHARDWDVAFSSDGEMGSAVVDKTRPLIHFLTHLENLGGSALPEHFIDGLSKSDFELPEGFHLLNFYPIGVPDPDSGRNYENPLGSKSWDELLVMSPFVQEKTIKRFVKKTDKSISLLSRKDELDSLDENTLHDLGKGNCYQFSEFISEAESMEELGESTEGALFQSLHGKLFIGKKGDYAHWFLGSANATEPAFERNIEFLVELKGESPKLYPGKILNLLTKSRDKIKLFEPYESQNRESRDSSREKEHALRKIVYDLSKLSVEGEIEATEKAEGYNLIIRIDASGFQIPAMSYTIKIRPLPEEAMKSVTFMPGARNLIKDFTGYSEIHLSPFIVWEIYDFEGLQKSFVSAMKISLPETRLRKIFRSVIDSQEKFIKYLSFVLTGREPELIRENGERAANREKPSGLSRFFLGSAVFENLLLAASRHPERLESIDQLISRFKNEMVAGEEIIPKDFEELWSVFQAYLQRNNT